MILPGSALGSQDLAKLEQCGIPNYLAQEAMLRRVESLEGGALIGRNGGADYAGIAFPYVWPGEDRVREYRLRRDRPDLEQKPGGGYKERQKYLAPEGRGNMLYFVPGTKPERLTDTELPIVLVEGEKKALAVFELAYHGLSDAADMRWLPVAIPGVWNWRGTIGKEPGPDGSRRDVKGPIPDLDRIAWRDREVAILFDANVRTNDSVRAARSLLTRDLQRRGAKVTWVDLPEFEGNGIDDFVGHAGPNAAVDLITKHAKEPREQERAEFRVEDILPVCGRSNPITYVREPELPVGAIVALTGDSESGKSSLATAFIRDANAEGIPALILDRENPLHVAEDRMNRLGLKDSTLLRWAGGWDGDVPGPASADIYRWVEACDPKPIVLIDSLAAFLEADENSATEMRRFMNSLRKLAYLGATVIIIHHDGKGETTRDYRGSSDFKAAVDQAFHVTNISSDRWLDRMNLRCFKSRYGLSESIVYHYADGHFRRDTNPDAPKISVAEQLTDLLRQNPRIGQTKFEALASKQEISRTKAREFLANGVLAGVIKFDPGFNNSRLHYLPDGDEK